ncbi:MAG: hypothetical protein AB1630_07645 [bacterium]
MNILVNILESQEIGILYILFSMVFHLICLATPFILAYILFKILSKRLKKLSAKILLFVMLFLGAFLFEMQLLKWIYGWHPRVPRIWIFRYELVCFFLYYAITLTTFIRKSKKVFSKILSVVIISLIFGSLTIFYIEEREIMKDSSDSGSGVYMGELKRDIQEYVMTYKEYPTHEDGISRKLQRYPPQVYGTFSTGSLYGLTRKKYTAKDNPNFMVAWDEESHGIILKWRYVIFVGKKEPKFKMISERTFQKLLKAQQEK